MGVVVLTASAAERLQSRLAAALARAGAKPGDRVALIPGDPALTAERLCFVGGALRSGVIPVVLHAALTETERTALINDAQPRLTVDDATLAALTTDGAHADLAPAPLGRPMLYTSGTTGEPKGVWTGVLDEAEAVALQQEEIDLWGFDADDRHLVCGNVHHSAPLRFALGTLAAGGEVILPGKFDAATQLAALHQYAPTTSFMAPVHLHRLLDLAGDDPALFASFRMLAHAGAPCSDAVKRRALNALPAASVWEFYGSTEGQFTACDPDDWLARPGTVGRARPGRTLHVDDDGLIWCAPPSFARFTYWNDPAKTAAAWRDGAFTVGDLGRIDDDGFLYLDGRRDDLILTGGVNVYPAEVERVLLEIPGVSDGAVFARDDARWGERVCAVYVGDAPHDDVRAALRARLAGYKLPKELHHRDEIPRSANGKIRRTSLAADLDLD
ncbi:MAG: fatty acid--CoA ligase family protein [Acidimicrobiales bacterium]|nr:fatty acid--CoA ligase family protein [Acidimicrobiales bacterium]